MTKNNAFVTGAPRDPLAFLHDQDRRYWTLDRYLKVIADIADIPAHLLNPPRSPESDRYLATLNLWSRNYAEAAWLGAPVKHVADWEDHQRVKRIYEQALRYVERRGIRKD